MENTPLPPKCPDARAGATSGISPDCVRVRVACATAADGHAPAGAAGWVVEVGERVAGLRPGDRVACRCDAPADTGTIITAPGNRCAATPEHVNLRAAALAAAGARALHAMHRAELHLGETIAVLGDGPVARIAALLAEGAGCGLATKDADAVLICGDMPPTEAMARAAELVRERGRVIVCADATEWSGRFASSRELDVRFAHGQGPIENDKLACPIGYVRWTEARNMACFLDHLSQRPEAFEPLAAEMVRGENAPATARADAPFDAEPPDDATAEAAAFLRPAVGPRTILIQSASPENTVPIPAAEPKLARILAQAFSLADAAPRRVHATSGDNGMIVTLEFANGSIASIAYNATDATAGASERAEAMAGGCHAIIENRTTLTLSKGGRTREKTFPPAPSNGPGTNAGLTAAVAAISESIRRNRPVDIVPSIPSQE